LKTYHHVIDNDSPQFAAIPFLSVIGLVVSISSVYPGRLATLRIKLYG